MGGCLLLLRALAARVVRPLGSRGRLAAPGLVKLAEVERRDAGGGDGLLRRGERRGVWRRRLGDRGERIGGA